MDEQPETARRPMRMQFTFRSGAQVTADISEFTSTRSTAEGTLTSLKWTTPNGWLAKLHYIDITEVVAIVAQADDGGAEQS